MKKSLRYVALGGIIALSIPAFLFVSKNIGSVKAYTVSELPTTIDLNDTSSSNIRSYYSSLNSLATSQRQGTNLLKNLKTILKNNQKYYAYDSGSDIWKIYEIADRDWDKSPASSTTYGTYNSSTNKITNYEYGTSSSNSKNNPYIHALYINRNVTNQTTAWDNHNQDQWGINREHVWPKAEGFENSGAGGARGDPFHLMAGNGYANNIHSNYYYGYVDTSSSYTDCGSKYSNQSGNLRGNSKTLGGSTSVFEPQDCDKGDIARAIFYMVARYNYLSGSDSDGISSDNPNLTLTQSLSDWASSGYSCSTTNPGKMGILTDLLNWHHSDPVDEYEIHRNNLLYTNYTNNRNPFIDFPEWVDYIWGTATYSGKNYQSYSSTPTGYATPSSDTINGYNSSSTVSVTGVTLNKNSTSIEVGSTETLEATVAPANATNPAVAWTSSNESIATITDGVVRGIAEGSATITVRTVDGNKTATCAVTVTAAVTPPTPSGDPVSDTMCAKAFGGYTTNSYSAAGTDRSGNANLTNNSGATYAMQVFNGQSGAIRGNQATASSNFSLRNTTTYNNYYVSSVSITVNSDGTLDGSTSGRSVAYFGSSAFSNPTTAPTGTAVTATPNSSGQTTLTWTNTNTANNYFLIYNLKTANTPKSVDADSPITVTWLPAAATTKELSSISLDTSDAKTTFIVGETFDYTGLVVTANYDDGTSDIVTPTSVSSPNMSSAGTKTVTVSYTEDGVTKTATYNITVTTASLTSIEVSGAKTSYYVGDIFVKPTVTAHYSNGSSEDVSNSASYSGYNLSNAGNQTVTVSYTFNGTTKTASYSITVTAVTLSSITVSGYTTAFNVGDTFTFGGTVTAHYNNGTTADVTASATFSGYNMSQAGGQTVTVSYGGKTATYSINVTNPSAALTATFVVSTYASANSWSNSTAYLSATVNDYLSLTVEGTGYNGYYYTNGTNWRFYQNGDGALTLSSTDEYVIDSVTITYSVTNTGTFVDKDGNVVASDSAYSLTNAHSVTFYVANTSTATNGTVRVTSMSITYHNVSSVPMSAITASVDKTYAVGETISSSDITVMGNNGQIIRNGFTFANNGYQFLYSDSIGGGESNDKTFSNAVTYSSYTCSLTVQVKRTAYTYVGTTYTGSQFSDAGISSSYTENQTATVDGITFNISGYIYYGKISLTESSKYAPGSITNTSAFASPITNVVVNGASPDIQLSTNKSTWVDLGDADTANTNYYYLKIFYKNTTTTSNYINITDFLVSTKGSDTAINVANYIMYEDTDNQCVAKFEVAQNYFANMSSTQRNTFMTSSDYVISTARTRFQAWAAHQGKEIVYENSDYVVKNVNVPNPITNITSNSSDNSLMITIMIISFVSASSIAAYFLIKKRRHE